MELFSGAGAAVEGRGRVADPPPDAEPWLGAYPRAWPEVAGPERPVEPVAPVGGAVGPEVTGLAGVPGVPRVRRVPLATAGRSVPGAPVGRGVPGRPDEPVGPVEPAVGAVAGLGTPAGPSQAVAGARWSAVRERMPVWVQARCGMEPRTVAAVAVVLVAALGFAAQQYWSGRPRPVTAPAVVAPPSVPSPSPAPGAPAVGGGARIVVDVGGGVREPGVRRLPGGSRVEDALAAAGGVRPGTDTTGLNRARILVDGEQVLVGVTATPVQGGPAGPGGAGPGPGPLSLASATVEQLDGLPGVGPVLARHIVDFRTARGGFRTVEDLRQVDGIGERRFADLRGLVRP
ncbi:helix-hairpin-helix domain-containing protein [Streptomyces lavendulae]|uniref:helix-hairpin-helix domain-containing protein n=1 Tax=Streptomyces lavendulae TaxID=1914 RepID=UPI0036905F58